MGKKKNLKKKKTRKNRKRLTLILFLMGGIILTFLFSSSIFALKQIRISGNRKVSSNKIVRMVKILPRENIFLVSSKGIEKLLAKEPWIKNVEVKKLFPSSLLLSIKERKEKMIISSYNNFFLADEEGVILEKIQHLNSGSLPVVTGFNYRFTPGERIKDKEFLKVVECLKYSSYISEKLLKIKISESKKFYLYPENGIEIRIGDGERIKEKLQLVPHLLKKAEKEGIELSYLDLQVETHPAGGIRNKEEIKNGKI